MGSEGDLQYFRIFESTKSVRGIKPMNLKKTPLFDQNNEGIEDMGSKFLN